MLCNKKPLFYKYYVGATGKTRNDNSKADWEYDEHHTFENLQEAFTCFMQLTQTKYSVSLCSREGWVILKYKNNLPHVNGVQVLLPISQQG